MDKIRGSSYDFRNDAVSATPTSPGENSTFHFPNHSGKKTQETHLQSHSRSSSPVSDRPLPELLQRRSSSSSSRGDDVVIRCSSNASFRRKPTPTLLKTKTKSRLLDHPDHDRPDKRSGRLQSGQSFDVIEDDDPFLDDDLPDEYKKTKFSCFSLIQFISSILIVAALICTLIVPYLKRKTLWGMQLWKWGVMILVLICGGLISGWLIRIVVFFIERNFLLRKRVLYFVYGVRNAVRNCLWLGWVLLSWNLILDQKVEREIHNKYLSYITKLLVCFLVATIIWLFKTLLVKVLAMSFHVSAFFDRIQDALFNQYVIETLSSFPSIEIQRIRDEEDRVMCEVEKLQSAGATVPADLRANCLPRNGGSVGKSPTFSTNLAGKEVGMTMDRLHRLNQKNVSAWNMKRLMSAVRKGVLSTIDEHLPGNSSTEDENSMHIRSEKQAKSAAKRIFDNVARPGSRYIYEDDLLRFMREDVAMKAMRLFEGSTDSDGISKKALKNWVVNVFRERRALALSLNDTKTAVKKLHHLLNALVGFSLLIIWLLILDVPITHFLVFISSQLLLLTFIFGNTFKTTFEAIVFLFVMHPFDVGDRCEIDEVQMIVEEMNLLTTVFLRYDNRKIIYPNSVLATKPISNYYRSPDMGDAIDFCVHISTPVEKIALMKERVTRYIENKKDHWHPSPAIVMREVEDMNRIKFSVWLSHTMNHQDMGERWARRALLVEEMVQIFKNLDIEYRMLPMDVNVRALPSLVSDRLPSNWTTCSR